MSNNQLKREKGGRIMKNVTTEKRVSMAGKRTECK